jgi:hypothetical protein
MLRPDAAAGETGGFAAQAGGRIDQGKDGVASKGSFA